MLIIIFISFSYARRRLPCYYALYEWVDPIPKDEVNTLIPQEIGVLRKKNWNFGLATNASSYNRSAREMSIWT
jgi:hypothetical protein